MFNRMDAWSLMRGDAFIHFVSGSRRVNIQLGVLLLIPKSPQIEMYGYTSGGQLVKIDVYQLCANTGGRVDILPRLIIKRDG